MIPWTDLRIEFDPLTGEPIKGEICFSHVDDVTGQVRHFAVERIQKEIERMAFPPPIITFSTDLSFARFALQKRGVEPHRYNRITPQDVIAYPIIMAYMPGVARDTPGQHLIIDGIHRYCKATLQWGWKEMRAYELQPEFWERFLVQAPPGYDDMDAERLSNQHINPIDSRIK